MLKMIKADLHVHTCLSPCADLKMSPLVITERAKAKSIEIVGICDHNSAENVPAVMKVAKKYQITVFPGMEVTSKEEVHLLGLFDRLEDVWKLQEIVYENLPGENDEEAFGMQVIVNEKGEVLGSNPRLLIGATTISLEKIIELIHSFNGIVIASHVDKEAFSLISQLGFIPENLELDAVEISPRTTYEKAKDNFSHYPITSSSDAHFPEEIGQSFTSFLLEECTIKEIKKALKNQNGRKLIH